MDSTQNLSSLANDAASIEAEGGGFMKPGEKRKRGRPKKGTTVGTATFEGTQKSQATPGGPSNGPQIDPTTELLPLTKTITQMYSNILVMYAEDERAKLDSPASDALSHASAACLVQYFPNSFGTHAALILMASIVGTTGFNAWILRRENLAKLKAEKSAMNGIDPTVKQPPEPKIWS